MAEIPHVQNPVTAYAKSKGWLARRVQFIGRNGCPDSWFFKRKRRPIVIEFKDFGKEPNEQQMRQIKLLREYGLDVHVIDNYEDGCALFD
ncbi:VRR-NUC domain protein [Hartmannibacter diazotrophicus]|uniref:VRR-NUC domain protein n=1 Tax=Hartmannibacter diazotrophicus TaxID=1482074 RepID=A0A2C9D1P6_9HYPH|nr:hypothetical protein [Hartmannibacter diazotrophicus]SON54242.1 VRR-NUC domain protein [Hartmannibacter diazotrophicus]